MNVTSTAFGDCVNYIRDAIPTFPQVAFGGLSTTFVFRMVNALAEDLAKEKSLLDRVFTVGMALPFLGLFPLVMMQVPRMREAVIWGAVGGIGLAAVALLRFEPQYNFQQYRLHDELPAHMIWKATSRVCFNPFKTRKAK